MSSYNHKMNKTDNPNPSPNNQTSSNIIQNNDIIKELENNNGIHKKKFMCTRAFIITGISIFLAMAVLTIILVCALRNKKTKSPIRVPIEPTDVIETTNIIITDHFENGDSYEEAEKIIGNEKTKKVHELLNKTSNKLGELILNVNTSLTNLSLFNETIGELPKNLDFLKNTNESALLVAKEDLDLYMESFSAIPEQINNLTDEMSKIMKNVSDSLLQYKKDIEEINKQYENNIKFFAKPLLSDSNNLRNLEEKSLRERFEEELDRLVDCYNKDIEQDDGFIESISGAIRYMFEVNKSIFNLGKDVIVKAGGTLLGITMDVIHPCLILLKDYLISYHNDLEIIRNELKEMGQEVLNFASYLNDEEANIMENLKNLIMQFGDNFKDAVIPFTKILFSLRKGSLFKAKVITGIALYTTEFIVSRWNIYEIRATTSLDLLFIVDLTGSMKPYLNEIKEKIINIIDGIIVNCPGININLGFIGYRDFYEDYIDIDFTEDHNRLKDTISKIRTSGGKWYYPDEDLAFALELALNKTWVSNAKLAVLIADAPGHGIKYGGHEADSSYPKRRELDEMVIEMFGKGISLYCLKITEKTDIMFRVFENIYNETNPTNANFKIIDNDEISSFTDSVMDYASEIYKGQRDNDDNCLLPKKKAVEILKSKYGINNNNPDDNLRFILGPCNPVLLVPGVYATKLKVELNCKGISKNERDTTLKDIRLYCGHDICPNEEETNEEHSLLFSFLDFIFGIDQINAEKQGACLGFISNFFMNENECPKVNNKNICYYSKYIKVAYYGGTVGTKKDSRCGIEGITNVVQTGDLLFDSIISTFVVKAAGSFNAISKNLIDKGFKEGFSLGAIPNDYRRYLATNNFASEVFKYQINKLYEHTGKPVVIIGHSYGTLLTLTNLLKNEKDKEFLKKIKKFIAMAPPFSGSTKLLDIFFHGNGDFNNILAEYPLFGQYLQYKSMPTIMELRPLPMAANIFIEPEYKELGDALRDRIEIENDCYSKDCDLELIKEKTEKFDEIFKGYFPSLLDEECAYESDIRGKEESLNRKCFTYIYNVGECPTIITKKEKETTKANQENFENNLCQKFGKNYFYQGECNDSRRNCLDKLYYSDQCPNPFNNKEAVQFLINRFNYNNIDLIDEKMDETYFDDFESIKMGIKKSIEHQKEIDLIKELPVPPVDTDLLYASFYKTISVLAVDDNDFKKEIKDDDIFKKGGDGTVQTWSSLLTGLKWIYDIKKNNLTQKVKLIEYCSRLGQSGKYKFNQNREQNFAAIKCDCYYELYDEYMNIGECEHATMLKDKYLIEYLFSTFNNKENMNYDIDSKKEAVNKYDSKFDYTQKCNDDIYSYLSRYK